MLYTGQSIRVSSKDIKKITVTNPRVIKVLKESKDFILVKAKRKGSASIYILKKGLKEPKQYSFTVLSSAVYRKLITVRDALVNIKGIDIKNAGEYVYINGKVRKESDLLRINKIANLSKKIISNVRLDRKIIFSNKNKLIEDLINIGLTGVKINVAKNILFIKGEAKNKKTLEDGLFYAKRFFPSARCDFKLIPYQIDIDVKIIEIVKSEIQNLGLDFPSTYDLANHSIISKIKLDTYLNMAEQNGKAKVLSNPSLSSNDNEKASFHVGGSIPIKLTSKYSSDLNWKNYGVILSFLPSVLKNGVIKLAIESEFSNVDSETKENDVPSFSVRKVNTVVTVRSGRTVVISGLINKNKSFSNSGLPYVSKVPVLSSVFSSNSKNKIDTEIAVIVTPRLKVKGEEYLISKDLKELFLEVTRAKG